MPVGQRWPAVRPRWGSPAGRGPRPAVQQRTLDDATGPAVTRHVIVSLTGRQPWTPAKPLPPWGLRARGRVPRRRVVPRLRSRDANRGAAMRGARRATRLRAWMRRTGKARRRGAWVRHMGTMHGHGARACRAGERAAVSGRRTLEAARGCCARATWRAGHARAHARRGRLAPWGEPAASRSLADRARCPRLGRRAVGAWRQVVTCGWFDASITSPRDVTMWSMMPYALASSADMYRSRSKSRSMRSTGCPVCFDISSFIFVRR